MRKVAWMMALGLAAMAPLQAAPKFDLVVAPNGNDAWSGKSATVNRRKTDGPLATLDRARLAVRELRRAQPGLHRPVIVLVREGTYYLPQPISFSPEDSGTPDSPTVYQAYPGEQPVFSGGVAIRGWQVGADGRWHVHLPDVQNGAWNFEQLFKAGQRMMRPRLPKNGYYFIAGDVPPAAGNDEGYDSFRFRPGEFQTNWANPHDVEVLTFQTWTIARLRVDTIDEANRIVHFTGGTHSRESYGSLPAGHRFIIENVKEALDAPGEWYLDRPTGELTYARLPGENPARDELVAPRLERLVQFQGDVAQHRWVQNITLDGLSFEHSNWTTPPKGYYSPQAEVVIPAAVTAQGARDCALIHCTVAHGGTYAVEWGAGCKRNRVEECQLLDMGAGGVKIGEGGIKDDEEAVASDNVIRNNVMAHGGRMHPAAVGVWIGQSHHNVIEHNEITDFYYTGISAGWTWGYGRSLCHDNRIAFNHIHNIGQGVLSDMGGIYTLGISTGSVLLNNVIQGVVSFDYGGWGIYPDEGTSNLLIQNNIAYECKSAGFHQHYGQDNQVINNIFADNRDAQLARTRIEDHISFHFDRNIVFWNGGALFSGDWSRGVAMDHQDYWNGGGEAPRFGNLSFQQWQATGQDQHSIIADPLFVDAAHGDFRLKPGSPALTLGFQPIDASQAGPTVKMPVVEPMRRAFPPPPPPQPIAENFEDIPVGQRAPGAITSEEIPAGNVRVTDETAATGKHSLKFTDAAGQKYSYNPHIYFQPTFNSGMMAGHFALKMEPGSIFSHEWRDNGNPYHTGPSLRVEQDGWLTSRGQRLIQIPTGQWTTFDITCGLGDQATGQADLKVRALNSSKAQDFKLTCDAGFKSLRWYGFVADANGPGVFYVDDIWLGAKEV